MSWVQLSPRIPQILTVPMDVFVKKCFQSARILGTIAGYNTLGLYCVINRYSPFVGQFQIITNYRWI